VVKAVVLSPWQIQLNGSAPGQSNVMVWQANSGNAYQNYNVIIQRDVSLLARQLADIAPNVWVSPVPARNTVILKGEVDNAEQEQLVLRLAKAYFSDADVVGNASAGSQQGSPQAPQDPSGATPTTGAPPTAGGGASGGGSSAPTSITGATTPTASNVQLPSTLPGSAALGFDNAIINLITVKGRPSTRLAMVQDKLTQLHPNIKLDVVAGQNGVEKAMLMGKVPNTGYVAKAINITSLVYGQPGIKVINGPAGNGVRSNSSNDTFQTADSFSTNMDVNLLQGMVATDMTGNVVSLLEVDQKPQVRTRVKILEVSRRASELIGIPYAQLTAGDLSLVTDLLRPAGAPGNTGAFALPIGTRGVTPGLKGLSGGATGTNDFNLILQALEEKQLVRSLAQPTLVALSGEKASFLAGGQVPIPISDNNGRITIEYKEFGIRLNIVATVTDEGKLHMQVAPEVSTIDPSLNFSSQVITIPGLRSRRMQTTLEVLPGQQFVMAGLFNTLDNEALNQVPLLGKLPVIGALFRNNFREKTDTELLVILQPEIITSGQLAIPTTSEAPKLP
jgi:Flp pilus assembly secretin CpaC